MSKCREAYETLFAEPWMEDRERSNLWQAAWNTRGKVDAEICRNERQAFSEEEWRVRNELAEAIEQENEK